MLNVKVLILSGYGLNCEEETKTAFINAGADADIIHINELTAQKAKEYQIFAIPGGFSFGDHLGAGKVLAEMLRHKLQDYLNELAMRDVLVIGICNGCQILVNLKIVSENQNDVFLKDNDNGIYTAKWISVENTENNCIWLKGIDKLSLPIAHGEGKFVVKDTKSFNIALRYCDDPKYDFGNPNGSQLDIAAITNKTGRILAIMPHPERAIMLHQHHDYFKIREQYLRNGQDIPNYYDAIKIFKNAVEYFS